MKFKLKKLPIYGDIKFVKKFLLFPKEINREVRWLEKTKIKQRAIVGSDDTLVCWEDVEWVDD